MRIITDTDEGTFSISCTMHEPESLRPATSRIGSKILTLLAHKGPCRASEIARASKESMQNIHYHLTQLRKANLVRTVRDDDGARVELVSQALTMRFGTWKQSSGRLAQDPGALSPFIKDGALDATIIIGSPDPHGPEGARSRDASYAVEFALFLGTFLDQPPANPVVLDTEVRDWDTNLIIIGGPVVNKAAERVNHASPAPYLVDEKAFRSRRTSTKYGQEHVGAIARFPNPFAKGKHILLLTGRRFSGTRAAILSMMRDPLTGTRAARIVDGRDADSDGIIDSTRTLE